MEFDASFELSNYLVVMRRLTQNDFTQLFKVASDPLIWELHPTNNRYQKDVFQVYFDKAVESNGSFAICDVKSGAIIGATRFYGLDKESSQVSIGYTFLARNYWGGKFNYSVKMLMLNYAFQFVNKVTFHVGIDNFRSQQSLAKIGAKKIGIVDFDHYGQQTPYFEYEILNPRQRK